MARELKYSTHHTDFDALQRELSGGSFDDVDGEERDDDDSDDYDDTYRR